MVAVVSGNGLGLFNTSLNALGAGIGGQATVGQGNNAQQVNVVNGNLVLTAWDESLFGRGFSTAFTRTYNSQGSFSNTGADGWYTGYERTVRLLSGTVNTAGSVVERATADGAVQTFAWNATTTRYESSAGDGAHDSILLTGSGASARWVWTEGSSQVQEKYIASNLSAAGALESITDLATGAAYTFTYNASNQLTVITGANGETLEFTYASTTGPLTAVGTRERDAAGTLVLKGQVTYGYDAANRLSWVQTDLTPTDATDNTWDATTAANNDGKRFRTTYTYADATSLRITNVSTSDGVSVSYTYDGSGRVQAVTQGSASDGSTQTLSYTYRSNPNETDVVDAAGRKWTYQYDTNGQLTGVLAPAVNGQRQYTGYTYDVAGNLTRISQAAYSGGAAALDTVFKYDANGNVILQRDRLGNTIERTYNSANRLATEAVYSVADADGLDPGFTGTTNLPSGALVTRYVYDTTNPRLLRYVINAVGEVTENQYNASGSAANQLSMSRRFTAAAYNISGLAVNAVPTLAQMNTWVTSRVASTARSEIS
jgi:YD repeat-containing protein